eukprot:3389390-Karenia_brevis.AAC.1
MNPAGNDDCGQGDITPNTTDSEPSHQTSWGNGVYNLVSTKNIYVQTPRPTQQDIPCQLRDGEDDCKYFGSGICPWLSDCIHTLELYIHHPNNILKKENILGNSLNM